MTDRRIDVLTGTRAEFGILRPLVAALADAGADVGWLACGMHLLEDKGLTVEQVRADAAPVRAEIETYRPGDPSPALGAARLTEALARRWAEPDARPDLLVVLGDRFEPWAAASAATAAGIPIAHLHGGERTEGGHVDDALRHAISRLAHVHLAATKQAAARLRAWGEEPSRVHHTGSPMVDALLAAPQSDREALAGRRGLPAGGADDGPLVLLAFHPTRATVETCGHQCDEILGGLARVKARVLAVHPNNDPGHEHITEVLERTRGPRVQVVPSLPPAEYAAWLACVDAVVGNSSSGLIEAPVFGTPAVNVGERQAGRDRGANVVDCEPEAEAVAAAVRQATTPAFREQAAAEPSPYGEPGAAERCARVLMDVETGPELLRKRWTDGER